MVEALQFGEEDEVPQDRVLILNKNDKKPLFISNKVKQLRITTLDGISSIKL